MVSVGPFANTVGPALPFTPTIRGGTGNLSVSIDAGQLTLTGQSFAISFGATYAIVNRSPGPALPFSPTLRGYTQPTSFNVNIDPGQLVLTGQSILVDIQSPRISAVKWDPGPYFEFSPKRPAYTAIQGGNISVPIDTAGQITLAGQSITMALSVPFSAGQVTLAGQSITSNFATNITAGSIVIQGQSISSSIGGSLNRSIEPGAIVLQGQDIAASITVSTTQITIRIQIEPYHQTMSIEPYHLNILWL